MAATCCGSTTRPTATIRATAIARRSSTERLGGARRARRTAAWTALVLVEAGAALAQSPRAPLEPTDARATSASERAATRSAGTDAPALVEPAASPAFGFETGSADPSSAGWSASGAAAIVDERASEGTRSLRLDGRSRPARARLRIAAPRVEGNRIRISFDAAADDAAALTALARVDGPDGLLFVERRDLPL